MKSLLMLVLILTAVGGGVWLIRRRTVTEYVVESVFQTVKVQRKGSIRMLRFDSKGQHGAINLQNPNQILFPYQQGFLLYRSVLPEVRSFLAIGVGTGTALRSVRRLHPHALMYGVDIDSEVIRVAQKFFDAPDDDRALYYAMDGRRFLHEAADGALFDLVFLDAYADDRVPAKLETVEFVRLLKSRMTANGVVCVNLIAALRGAESKYLRRVWRTYRDVFQNVMIVPTSPFARESQNILLFAYDGPLPTREQIDRSISNMPWPTGKRRLNRMADRLFLPEWNLEQESTLTDESVRIFAHRSTRY